MAEPRYRYGGDSAIGAFLLPERREILRDEQNQFIGYDDQGNAIIQTIPAEYGESEVDLSYSPVVRSADKTLSFLRDVFSGDPERVGSAADRAETAIRGVIGGLTDYASNQYEAGMAGGTIYDPETGQITEFDPTAVMVSGAPAGIQAARNTPSNQVIFGTMGSKTANYTPDQRRVMDELERQGMDTKNLFLHGTSDDIRQPTSSRTGSRDSGFIGKGFYGATPEGSRIADYYANTAAPKFRNEAGEYSEPNVFPYITRRGNYKQYSLADKQALSKQARQDEFFGQDLAKKNIDEGFIGAEVVDADGNIIERVNYFPDTDTRSALNYDTTTLYSGGGRQGAAIAGGSALRGLDMSAGARMQRAQDQGYEPIYHGSTYDIEQIDLSGMNPESHFGRGFYSTTSPRDASENYAHTFGPDLKNKITQRAERIEDELELTDEMAVNAGYADVAEMSFDMAKKEVQGPNEGVVYPLMGRTTNAFDISNDGDTFLRYEQPQLDPADYLDEAGGDMDTAYDLAQQASYDFEPEGELVDFLESLRTNSSLSQDDFATLQGSILEEAYDGGISANRLDKIFRSADIYPEDDAGNLISHDIFRQAIQDSGYDTIIHDANIFRGMDVDQGTKHKIYLDPSRVRSINAEFDPEKIDSADLLSSRQSERQMSALRRIA